MYSDLMEKRNYPEEVLDSAQREVDGVEAKLVL